MKIRVSESFFNLYKRLLSEQDELDLDEYDDEDFIEVFFQYFRPWVKSKHGEDVSRYPLSALLKKYFSEFAKEIGYGERYQDDDEIEYWGTSQLVDIGMKFVELGKHSLPTLKPKFKFTEQYAKPINILLKQLDLPEWLTFTLEEKTPYNVVVKSNIDFAKFLEYKGDNYPAFKYYYDFVENLENILGIKMGSPAYGGLSIKYDVKIFNYEKFSSPQFQKELKKEIKSVEGAEKIYSIVIEVNEKGMRVNLRFKGDTYYYDRRDIGKRVSNKLASMGYNMKNVTVAY